MDWPSTEPGPPRWEASDLPADYVRFHGFGAW